VLRVLGNLLGLPGFEQESVEEVRAEALGDVSTIPARLSNAAAQAVSLPSPIAGLQRWPMCPSTARQPGAPFDLAATDP
jgi:NADH-quinone oxidoreductase subunit G